MRNASGDLSAIGSLLRISLAHFEADVLPTLTAADAVVLLGCGLQPPSGHDAAATDARAALAAAPAAAQDDAMPSARLWALVPKLRAAGVGSVGLLCAAPAAQAAAVAAAAASAAIDASAVVALRDAGFAPGHGGLAELSLKLMCNAVSTCAAAAAAAAAAACRRLPPLAAACRCLPLLAARGCPRVPRTRNGLGRGIWMCVALAPLAPPPTPPFAGMRWCDVASSTATA